MAAGSTPPMNENAMHSTRRSSGSAPATNAPQPLSPIASPDTSTSSAGATPRFESQPPSQAPGALTMMTTATKVVARTSPKPSSSCRKVGSHTIIVIHCRV